MAKNNELDFNLPSVDDLFEPAQGKDLGELKKIIPIKIKDISIQFQKDSTLLERKLRYRKYIQRGLIICFAIIILIVILYFIFKKE